MFSKIKQIQELRSQANQIKKALAEETVEGTGAWGKLKVKMDGNQEVKSVEIDDELLKDKVKLQAAIAEATNNAVKNAQKVMAQKMSQMGGLNLPGMN